MATLTINITYIDSSTVSLAAVDLNNACTSITTFLNSTGLDSTNVVAGSLTGANVASGAIGTTALAATSVTTAILANGAVAQVNRAALNIVTSSSCGAFTTTNTQPFGALITNFNITITTTGRPVCIFMQDDGTQTGTTTPPTPGSYLCNFETNTAVFTVFRTFSATTTTISCFLIKETSGTNNLLLPPCLVLIDPTPPTGSCNYQMRVANATGTKTISVSYAVFGAYEL
jgi:hypothetical protein